MSIEVRWDLRLRNWAAWSNDGLATGYQLSRTAPSSQRATPNERDAMAVEALLCRMKTTRRHLYRAIWQCYLMQRDDISASEVLRVGVPEYRDRLEAAWRWLDLAERADRRGLDIRGPSAVKTGAWCGG